MRRRYCIEYHIRIFNVDSICKRHYKIMRIRNKKIDKNIRI